MSKNKIRVGITQGDIGGIGYEIIIKTVMDQRFSDLCTTVVYGSEVAANHYKELIPEAANFSFNVVPSAENANPKRANLVICSDEKAVRIEPGVSTPVAGRMALESLDRAVAELKAGHIDVIVTCPINKSNVAEVQPGFVGHTEYFAAQFGADQPLMFMVSDPLKVGLLTKHIPLDQVAGEVTTQKIVDHLRLLNLSMVRDFGVRGPRVAVLGLNPHSGDGGLMGHQEQQAIIPAIEVARGEKILAFGPFAADGFFGSGSYGKFDAVLAMYHDQGLAPFKTIAFENGVNFTAGLSVVRTSPGHGVGYDIAGQGVADSSSLRAAIYTALDIFRNRAIFEQITANPLQSFARTESRPGPDRDQNVEDLNLGGHHSH